MKPEGSLPCSKETATGPYSKPDESSLYQEYKKGYRKVKNVEGSLHLY
jgi:hypothetical protein